MKLNIVLFLVVTLVARLAAQGTPPVTPTPGPLPLPPPLKETTFSFASDDHHAGPTFTVTGGNKISAKALVNLAVDQNSQIPGGQVTFQSILLMEGELQRHQVCTVSLPSTTGYVHTWIIKPTLLRFDHVSGGNTTLTLNLLEIRSEFLIFQAVSTSPLFILNAANISIHERLSPSLLFIPGPRMAGIGVTQSTLRLNEDAAFTLTNIKRVAAQSAGVAPIPIDAAGLFLADFVAEGSFSASALGF